MNREQGTTHRFGPFRVEWKPADVPPAGAPSREPPPVIRVTLSTKFEVRRRPARDGGPAALAPSPDGAAQRRPRRWAWAAAAATLAGVLALLACDRFVRSEARGRTYADPAAIPRRHVGVVLGCLRRLAPGVPNQFFDHRIRAAAALFRAGKVDYLLVSGDNHAVGTNEPHDMRDALALAGVPTNRIVCDYAGFRTLDSVVRVREVFGQTEVTFISQRFHNERAIFLARHRGLDAIGFDAADVDVYHGFRTNCREQLARIKAVLDIYVLRKQPKFLGPRVEIGTE